VGLTVFNIVGLNKKGIIIPTICNN